MQHNIQLNSDELSIVQISQNFSKLQNNKTLSLISAHLDPRNLSLSLRPPTSGLNVLQISARLWPVSKTPTPSSHARSALFRTCLMESEEIRQRFEIFCPPVLRDAQLIDPLPIRAKCFLLDKIPKWTQLPLINVNYEVQLIKTNISFNPSNEHSFEQITLESKLVNLWPQFPYFLSLQFNPAEFLNIEQRDRLIKLKIKITVTQKKINYLNHEPIAILIFSRYRKSQFVQTIGNSSRLHMQLEPSAPMQHRFQIKLPSDLSPQVQKSLKTTEVSLYARLQRMQTKTAQPYFVGESIALKLICNGWPSKVTFFYVVQANGRLVWTGTLRMNSAVRVFRLPALLVMVPVAVVALFSEHVGLVDFLHLHVEVEILPSRNFVNDVEKAPDTWNVSEQDSCSKNELKELELSLLMLSNLHYLQAQMPHNRLFMRSLCSESAGTAMWLLVGNQTEIQRLVALFELPRVHWLYNAKKVIKIFFLILHFLIISTILFEITGFHRHRRRCL